MCRMVFKVQGETDNYVKLKPDGKGIEFLGKSFSFFLLSFHFLVFVAKM